MELYPVRAPGVTLEKHIIMEIDCIGIYFSQVKEGKDPGTKRLFARARFETWSCGMKTVMMMMLMEQGGSPCKRLFLKLYYETLNFEMNCLYSSSNLLVLLKLLKHAKKNFLSKPFPYFASF